MTESLKRIEFQQKGKSSVGGNPMLPSFIANLGHDKNGKEWLCQVEPTGQMSHLLWNVDFDTNEEYEVEASIEWDIEDGEETRYSTPFLRPEVVYCKFEKWQEMHRIRYNRKTVEYHNILRVVNEFIDSHGIT